MRGPWKGGSVFCLFVFPGGLTPPAECMGKGTQPHSSVRQELRISRAGDDAIKGARCWFLKTLLVHPGEEPGPYLRTRSNVEQREEIPPVCD